VLWLAVTVMDESPAADGTRLLCLRDVTQKVTTWRDMRTFHTVISHKLVTPLNNLVGCLEMAVYDPTLSRKDLLDLVGTAHTSSEVLHAVVDEILRYLKGDVLMQIGGHFPLRRFPDLAARAAAEYGVVPVKLRMEAALLDQATGLSEQSLEWILWELLDSARKFHPTHEPNVEVRVAPARPGWACITLVDDGVSLSPEQITRVWAPYYQGEKIFTGETPGIGLGLPTIASLIWHVGGTCRLSNRAYGPGVEVELTVPLLNA
jgi:signal transduction histidine kinase